MAGREVSSACTPAMMSITGFAAKPGTAVLPMCSIGPTSHGASCRRRRAASSSNLVGHTGSYETISIGASGEVIRLESVLQAGRAPGDRGADPSIKPAAGQDDERFPWNGLDDEGHHRPTRRAHDGPKPGRVRAAVLTRCGSVLGLRRCTLVKRRRTRAPANEAHHRPECDNDDPVAE